MYVFFMLYVRNDQAVWGIKRSSLIEVKSSKRQDMWESTLQFTWEGVLVSKRFRDQRYEFRGKKKKEGMTHGLFGGKIRAAWFGEQ